MSSLPIIDIHLNKHVRRMVIQRHWVIFVVIDACHIAIPSDTSAEESGIELALGLSWVLLECLVPASFQIVGPRDIA